MAVSFMKNEKPNLDKDGWMWMLHGDVGEDNLVAGVLNKEDSTPGQWIESGPHLMYIPRDIKSLDKWNTDFTTGEPYVCLLYTSPSPRDLSTSRMPSSA